jgi:acetyl esterase/lipase
MTTQESPFVLHVPARDIPVPTSVSPEAQAVMALGRLGPPSSDWPALDDVSGWKAFIAEREAMVTTMIGDAGSNIAADVEEVDLGGFLVYVIRPEGVALEDRRVYLDIHGGAWIQGGGPICRSRAVGTAASMAATVWAVDYRMPPDYPYPTPLDDCVVAYQALLGERRPEEIIIGGGSAGGNLAAALILRARDGGLPLPAAVVLGTGAFDLTHSGDSWQTNLGLDNILTGSALPAVLLYANGHDLREPYLSPLFADLSNFPPTILTTGTRDLLLSDNVRFHRALRAAGVDAELHVWEAASHGGFLGRAPEDAERNEEIRRFMNRLWAATAPATTVSVHGR